MKEYDVAFREKITVKVRVWDNTGITITVNYSVGKWLSLSEMAVFLDTPKVAEHSFVSLWVYVICQIMAIERLQLRSWNLASDLASCNLMDG